jgi:hypothetical protein
MTGPVPYILGSLQGEMTEKIIKKSRDMEKQIKSWPLDINNEKNLKATAFRFSSNNITGSVA